MIRQIQILCLALISMLSLTSIVIAQDDRPLLYIAHARSGPRVDVLDARTLERVDRIPIEGAEPEIVILHPNKPIGFVSNYFLFGKGLNIVNLQTHEILRNYFPTKVINSISLGPDNKLYVLFPETSEIAAINIDTFEVGQPFKVNLPPKFMAFHPNKKVGYILTGERDQNFIDQLYELNLENNSIIRTIPNLPPGTGEDQNLIAVAPDGNKIYIARDGIILIVDTATFSVVGQFKGTRFTNGLKISPDGKTLYACDVDFVNSKAELVAIDLITGAEKRIDTQFGSYLEISPDGKAIYLGAIRSFLQIYDAQNLDLIEVFDYSDNGPGTPLEMAFGGTFTNIKPPSITLTNIKDGDTIQRTKPFTFTWQTTQGTANLAGHKIEISIDGGQTFIQQGDPRRLLSLSRDTREFIYQAPALSNDNVVIRVTAVDILAQKGVSIVKFRVGDRPPDPTDTQAPTVSFTKPSGGERFAPGDTINISWNSSDNIGVTTQDLALSTDGGSTFPITIASGLTGSIQSFNYQIPSSLETTSGRLRLVVRDLVGNSAQAITATNFQIQSVPPLDTQTPVVAISAPAPENNLFPAGQPITINWSSSDNVAVISQELLLSLDGGNSFQQISSFGGNTGTFTLNNIANLDKTISNVMVKITATDAAGNKGEQVASFSLRPNIAQSVYNKPILTITGTGFAANGSQSALKILINGKEIPAQRITGASNTSITLKGNKKKLGVVKGNNKLVISVNGVSSNDGSFNF